MDNLEDIIEFLNKNNMISVSIAIIFSNQINKLVENFVDNIILPFIDKDLDDDGIDDIYKLEDFTITIFNKKINIGKIISSSIKFFLIIILVYLLSLVVKKFVNKIIL